MSSSKHWKTVRLGDVATRIVGGGTPSRTNAAFWGGDIPWLTVKDMRTTRPADSMDHITSKAVKESSTNLIPADTVIIATRIGLGKVIRVPYEAAINQDLKAIIISDEIDKSFLEYWFLSVASYIQSIGSGTTVKGIRLEQLKGLDFPIPETIDEQRRIVSEIEKQFTRLDAGVEGLKRVQANLKRYRASVLKAACEGSLVPQEAELRRKLETGNLRPEIETGAELLKRILAERRNAHEEQQKTAKRKSKYKEPAAPDLKDLPDLPEGWTWANVEQLSFLDVGYAFKSKEFASSGVRLLRGENLEPGRMRWNDTRYWSEDDIDEFRHLLINEGEIVLAMDRPVVSSGLKIARARIDDLPCLLVQRMARFRPIIVEMTPFLFAALNTHGFIKHLFGNQTGTQLPHISGGGIQSFPIPLPPLAEQKRIVEEVERRLSVIEEMEAAVEANLKRATRLRQSILKKAFEGELV